MIGYLDTSAFVPLLIDEPTSAACRRFWDDADEVVSSRPRYVETAAALAQARRLGRRSGEAAEILGAAAPHPDPDRRTADTQQLIRILGSSAHNQACLNHRPGVSKPWGKRPWSW